MKSAFALVVLLAFGVPSVASPPSAPAVDESKSFVVPVELLGGHIFVKAAVNGQNARLVLDTGAGRMMLTPEFARKLGWKSGWETEEVAGIGGTVKAGWLKLNKIDFETIELTDNSGNLGALVASLPQGLEADGFIGYELFYSLVVTIDYTHSRLILTYPKDFQAPGKGLPLRLEDDIPAVEAVLDGRRVWLQLDTGDDSVKVTLNTPFVEREKLREKYSPRYESATGFGIGGQIFGEVTRGKALTFGSLTLKKPLLYLSRQKSGALADKDSTGSIGNGILSLFNATYDYGRKRLYLTPNVDLSKVNFVYSRTGLDFDTANFKTTITRVIPQSPGAAAGIKVGDEVIAVNDTVLLRLPKGELPRLINAAPGTKVKFLLLRKPSDAPFTANMILRDVL